MTVFKCSFLPTLQAIHKILFLRVAIAARLNVLLNPILRSHKVYANLLNYRTHIRRLSVRCSVEDNKIYHKFLTIFLKYA